MTNGTYLSKDAILKAMDLEYRDVAVPEWGGTVRMREMSAGQREHLTVLLNARAEAVKDGGSPSSANAIALGLSIVDANGERLFSEAEIDKLGEKNPQVLERLATVVMEINRLGPAAKEAEVKNSETSPSADSLIA